MERNDRSSSVRRNPAKAFKKLKLRRSEIKLDAAFSPRKSLVQTLDLWPSRAKSANARESFKWRVFGSSVTVTAHKKSDGYFY